MMKAINISLLIVILGITLNSCYKDNEEELYPLATQCDTLNVTYEGKIKTIISDYCIACHGSSNFTSLGGGIELEGYVKLKAKVDDGSFLSSVTHDGNVSFMPKNSGKLSDCNLAIIKKWIDEGALEK
ncbi:MAG: hypothetical protein M3Q58_08805 [Bacteroidota bacterium]|nr:hypothetical protein [Bacteroidota bacterium]